MRKIGWTLYLIALLSVITFSIYSNGLINFIVYFLLGLLLWRIFNYVRNVKEKKRIDKELEEIELREEAHKIRVLNAFKR